ncbi:anion permease [Undibacterium sp. LX40W]|uniref:Anion permease n=1 Tax=Undibacterium nitidum TaxID=2762298 RepID=A0A923HQ21_9BURK|nr:MULTISPECIES: SLC13 family permease [Undibacterium]MBC3881180.1 anion permease [Undibacterium nitidum]MBC3890087.1 anion permease [Undibacterium sp. LX40W]
MNTNSDMSTSIDDLQQNENRSGKEFAPMNDRATQVANQKVMDTLLQDRVLGQCKSQSLARLLPKVTQQRFQSGDAIFRANEKADHFYLLLSGTVRMTSAQGQVLDMTNGHFGEEAASDAALYLAEVTCTLDCEVLCIPRAAMMNLVEANATLKTDLFLSLTGRFSGQEMVRHVASEKKEGVTHSKMVDVIGWALALLCPLLILEFGEQWHLSNKAIIFSAIFSSTVIMWAFSLVDDYIPSLFALLVILVTGLVPAGVILSGFSSDGFLMALSTLGLGTVVVTSGLGYRFILWMLARLPNSQLWHNVGLFITGSIITPIIPTANGRIAIVAPFYLDMVESLSLKSRGAAATRLAISCFGGISLFSAVFITSKSVNFAVFGLLSPQGQDKFQWLTWCMAALVAGFTLVALNGAAAFLMFRNQERAHLPKEIVEQQLALLGKVKTREWAAIAGIVFMVVGIVTSSIHRVQPPWLGFTMFFCLLLCGSLDKKELKEKVDWTFLLYMSGITGIVASFNFLGLDKELGATLQSLGSYMRTNFELFVLLLFALVNVIRIVVPINAAVVILATVLMPLADINGVNAWVVGFIVLMFAEVWFLPFQCSYYLPLQELNRKHGLYSEKSFLWFNAALNFARLAAVYASIPYWKMLGIL